MTKLSSFDWNVIIARVLAVLWSVVWIWYGVARAHFQQRDDAEAVLFAATPATLLIILLLIARVWEAVAGGLLLLAGMGICVVYVVYLGTRFPWFVLLAFLLTLVLPPLLAGALFLAHWWRHQHHHPAHPA